MEEKEGWLLADHVIVQCDDVDARLPQRSQHGLDLLRTHDEVAVYRGQAVAAREGSPGVEAHRLPHLDLVHRALPTDAHFDDSVLGLALMAQDLLDGTRVKLSFPGRLTSESLARGGLTIPYLLDGVPHGLDARS